MSNTREKLIKLLVDDAILILKEEHKQRTDCYTTHLAHGGKGDPAEEVNLDALAMAISALEQTKWISVKDRLPDLHTTVLVYDRESKRDLFWYDENGFNVVDEYGYTYPVKTVTHWMPLPQPPKGE